MGRRNKYETNVKPRLADIRKWYETMTEAQIAKKLGVSVASFETYKATYPELQKCLKKAKETLIEDLRRALKMKAKGFRYKETKKTIRRIDGKMTQVVEEYDRYSPPDVGAIHLLLKNLDEEWRNDDQATLDLKREKIELDKQKADAENW